MAAWHRRLRARARARARGFREPLTAHGSGRGPLLLGGYVAALGCMTQRPPDIPAPGTLERFQVPGARAQASGRCPRRSTMDSPPAEDPRSSDSGAETDSQRTQSLEPPPEDHLQQEASPSSSEPSEPSTPPVNASPPSPEAEPASASLRSIQRPGLIPIGDWNAHEPSGWCGF